MEASQSATLRKVVDSNRRVPRDVFKEIGLECPKLCAALLGEFIVGHWKNNLLRQAK